MIKQRLHFDFEFNRELISEEKIELGKAMAYFAQQHLQSLLDIDEGRAIKIHFQSVSVDDCEEVFK